MEQDEIIYSWARNTKVIILSSFFKIFNNVNNQSFCDYVILFLPCSLHFIDRSITLLFPYRNTPSNLLEPVYFHISANIFINTGDSLYLKVQGTRQKNFELSVV